MLNDTRTQTPYCSRKSSSAANLFGRNCPVDAKSSRKNWNEDTDGSVCSLFGHGR
jgi:hypothetical protein